MKEPIKHWIFLPGLDGSGQLFNDFINHLKKLDNEIKVEIISLPHDCLTYQQTVDEVLKKLPQDKNYGLLGESFSGPMAISIASRNLENLKALCLVSTFAKTPHWSYKHLSKIVNYIPKLLTITKKFGYIVLSNKIKTHLKNDLNNSLSQINEDILKSRLIQISNINYENLLNKIKVKTLILNATQDLIVSKTISNQLSEIENSKTYWIKSPHFLLQTKPNEAAKIFMKYF